jgi:hypothetical protein
MPGLIDTSQYMSSLQRMQQQGNDLSNPYSASNQSNRAYMSQQFGSSQPNYFEIAASQGASGGVASMQQAAAKRQAGLLTGSNFGQMMNDNQKTALGYYGQAAQGQQGLLSMQYQDQARQAELEEKKREFDKSNGSLGGDILTTGLGVAGSVLGGPVGGAAGGLLGKWIGGMGKNDQTDTANGTNYPGFDELQKRFTSANQPNYMSFNYK